MRIAVYGAGAIGGLVAARLAKSGQSVSVIARGPQLVAIKQHGLRLIGDGVDFTVHLPATDDPSQLGPQDAVLLTLKAHAVPSIVDRLRVMLGPRTTVVTAVNGIPWWYFHGVEGPYRNRRVESVDPGHVQWDGIGPQRALGCVVYPAAEIAEPGVIRHVDGDRLTIGEPDGSRSDRAAGFSEALTAAGFKAPVRTDIRTEIWTKLWGNIAFNPISALTGATMGAIGADPETRTLAETAMVEAEAVAGALGIKLPVSLERRLAGAVAVGDHKTSMLQDLERGRRPELDAVVGAVMELGRLVGIATPTIGMLYALTRRLFTTRGLWGE